MQELSLGPIGQFARAVPDLAEAERFYRDVLGMRHLFSAGKLAFFDCGGVRLMLEDRSIIDVPDLHNTTTRSSIFKCRTSTLRNRSSNAGVSHSPARHT